MANQSNVFYSIELNMVSLKAGELSFLADQQSFLSNFYTTNIKHKQCVYKSAEHLFQAANCAKSSDREKIRNAATAKKAKIFGRFVELRPEWEKKKVDVMESILRIKFLKKSKLKRLLRETGDVNLTQLNYWHDTFWGTCVCSQHKRTGENMLGVILIMKIRAEIE